LNQSKIHQLNGINKGKEQKFHKVGTVPKLNRKIVNRVKSDTPNTYMHDPSL